MKDLNVLVPTDFSEPSRRALRAADEWVRLLGGQVTPLHVYEATSDLDGFHFYGPERSISGDLPKIQREIQRLLDESAGRDVDAAHLRKGLLMTGNPARSIAKASLDYDLIIMSSHGRSGFSRFFLGSVTDKVLRLAPVPVLVVGDENTLAPLKRILVPTDLSPDSAAAFSVAREVADASGAGIELLYVHVSDSTEVIATDTLESRVREFVHPHFHDMAEAVGITVLVAGGSAHEGVYRFIREKKCSLIVMAITGKSETGHHFLGNTPDRVVRDARAAALLVNPNPQRNPERAGPETD